MHEPPADALRRKKDSSMRVAINLVKDEVAQACVSAGNTGALMAISRFVLKTLPGIDRPAIASQLPTRQGGVVTVLDLGANVNCSPEQLVQFAVMGTALVAAVDGIERPTVGLLNIGEEEIKGNELAKQTGELLRASGLNFYGNVEGDDIYKGTTDVVVCDGFVGNVALKASEGLATMLYEFLKAEFTRNPLTRLAAIVAYPVLRAFKRRIDPRRYNGATLIGLKGVVVKSHGSADALAFRYALRKAYAEAAHGVLDKIAQRMAAMPALCAARDAGGRRRGVGQRCIAASPGPAATCRRRSSPTTISRGASTRATRGSARAPASASAASPRPDETTSDLALHAARAALAAAGIAPADVDLIVVATTTPDMVFPSTACILQAKLGAHGGPAFDVQAVCSGFVYALAVADRMVAAGMATQRAGRRRRDLFAHPRLERPRHLRAVRRRRRRGRAGAVAACRASMSAHLHADGRYRDILCVPGSLQRRRGDGLAVRAHGRPGSVQVRRQRDGAGRRRGARRERCRRGRHRLADPAPGQHPHHGCDGEEARRAARAGDRDRRSARQHVGGVDSAGARRGGARRARRVAATGCC